MGIIILGISSINRNFSTICNFFIPTFRGITKTMSKGLSMIVFLAVIAGSFALKHIIIEAGQIQIPIQLL
ncbi:hypothetical protein KHA80_15120 [Anaerobacillus sp. HL2]|nr:hypothetical protein KHA80_15120 [Anaerobacillus sp. HL2]